MLPKYFIYTHTHIYSVCVILRMIEKILGYLFNESYNMITKPSKLFTFWNWTLAEKEKI